jgi:hypothetical protein
LGLRGTRQWECRRLYNEELYDLYFSPNIIWVKIKKIEMGGAYCMYGGKERCIQDFCGKT